MKKALALTMILGLIFGSIATAEAGKKKAPKKVTREAQSVYDAPAIGSGAGICPAATNSCGSIPTGANENFVHIKIEDAAGMAVYASVGQDLDGDNFADNSVNICGESEEPLQITPGVELMVFPWAVGGPSCPGIATTGTVTATLSNLP